VNDALTVIFDTVIINREFLSPRAAIHRFPYLSHRHVLINSFNYIQKPFKNWTAKAKAEVEQDNAEVVIGILPARPDTRYWHRDMVGSASVFFLKGRLKFGNVEQVAPFPSCLVLWGGSEAEINAMQAALPGRGYHGEVLIVGF
jgi:hypothetical protein